MLNPRFRKGKALTDLAVLQQALGITFKDTSLLKQALMHSSYLNENPGLTSNERLEFLGDAVLGLIVAEKLYQDFPQLAEGDMTKLRARLVRRDTLASIATTLRLGDYLYLGKGEEASGGRHKPANLAGALEAIMAALYLDQDTTTTKDFILRLLGAELRKVASHSAGVDYKSELQELIQAREQKTPTYHIIEAIGPDHSKTFTIEVRLGEMVLGKGSGRSKKAAEAEAARSALARLPASFTP